MDEEQKAIKYISHHTGLSGIEAKHIYNALQRLGTVSVYDIDWKQAVGVAKEYGDRYKAVWNYLHELYGIPKPLTQEEIREKERAAERAEVKYGKKYLEEVIEDVMSKFENGEKEEIKEHLREIIMPEEKEEEKEEEEREKELEKRLKEEEQKREKIEERIEELEKRLKELIKKKEELEKKKAEELKEKILEEIERYETPPEYEKETSEEEKLIKKLESENPDVVVDVKIRGDNITIKGVPLKTELGATIGPFPPSWEGVSVKGKIYELERLIQEFNEAIRKARGGRKFIPAHIRGGIRIYFLCKDSEKVKEIMEKDFGISPWIEKKELPNGEICHLTFDLKKVGDHLEPSHPVFKYIIPPLIDALKNNGINIRIDTGTGYDPDTGKIYPVRWDEIVFPTPIEETKEIIPVRETLPEHETVRERAIDILNDLLRE